MIGRFVAVVGPSGVGKDSVKQAFVLEPNVVLARRIITRPAVGGAEDFEGVSDTAFDLLRQADAFALHWSAHGLRYAIPRSVDRDIAAGRDVLGNISRGMIAEAAARFARFEVISLTASRTSLAQRLSVRAREDAADIARRLDRPSFDFPCGVKVHHIVNEGTL
ncbi:phosphonate metabolism protein/1,5-bisphosphokinase (PRPP-forming) PhnN [Pontivivens nitratireducens]|uniref:ribose 1,5-bisphosphate phosphokinase n=1 Tax=Pontivivens nitratireducens TaxID=2758038 RepID=A0A6G7VND1_9RHOB|nr:phosphonate metabolism protein/1,5-bisphosphokinase (PRPP-forming) PhnN [Pontibrevibacter nitratireducens]QIK41358.1 phosphonate metabolism protein/1,5-bisphosphokinase (PRPP-forming) PhnN [Pontibrevibacter nitratireducens]